MKMIYVKTRNNLYESDFVDGEKHENFDLFGYFGLAFLFSPMLSTLFQVLHKSVSYFPTLHEYYL